jgi:hypothetical protein
MGGKKRVNDPLKFAAAFSVPVPFSPRLGLEGKNHCQREADERDG